mmetsp:Transcript_137935/g.384693  ORF Transcript_137935/g.384693 Transcript_137935/m.384693 type:complete len:480 (-) Transcript_137935:216-1655(-)
MGLGGWQGGAAASLCSSFCGTLGCQLRICSITCGGPRSLSLSLQVLGWSSWLLGQGLGQVAILLAPATIAACVTFSGSLMCNALLAPLVLHERLTWGHGLGVALLTLGGTCVTLSSDHSPQEYTWAQLYAFWYSPLFLVTCAGCAVMAFSLSVVSLRRWRLEVWSFAFLFALCGSVDLLVTKYTLQLLRICAEGRQRERHKELLPPGSVVLAYVTAMVVMHVSTFLFQVASAYYTKALESMPLILGSGCFVQVSLCGIFYQEFSSFTNTSTAAFLIGLSLVLMGMVVTSHAAAPVVQRPELDPELVFIPPTAKKTGLVPVERSESSLSSADLFLLGEIQRGALCYGERCKMPELELPGYHLAPNPPQPFLQRKFMSAPLFRPLLSSTTYPQLSRDLSASLPAMAIFEDWENGAGIQRGVTLGSLDPRKPERPTEVGNSFAEATTFAPSDSSSEVANNFAGATSLVPNDSSSQARRPGSA